MVEPPVHRSTTWRRLAWGLGIATASALTAFGVASWQAQAAPVPTPSTAARPLAVSDPEPAPEGSAGAGRDALTGSEADRAKAAALASGVAGSPTDVTGKPGPEYLSTDLTDGRTGRTAEVYLYDYSTDKLVKKVVDVSTGTVTKTYAAAGLQPPASEREVSTALDLLLADPLGARLTGAYRDATGKTFTGRDQIQVRAHVYEARPADTGGAECGSHRCLTLVVRTADGSTFLDVKDIIIDLSGRTVARLS